MVEITTRLFAKTFADWAGQHENVIVLSGDLTKNCEADEFRNRFPNRFFNTGLSEQNMLGVAGGFAREGFTPFLFTFGVFMYRRAMDQLQMSVAYPNLKVRLMGFLPGLTTPGGVSHQAIDDIAMVSALPNMTVVSIGDATELATVLKATENVDGPVYVSTLRGRVPRLFPEAEHIELGRSRILSHGDDLLVLSCGAVTETAMVAVSQMRQRGIDVTHLHVSTLKPFDDPQVRRALARTTSGVITVENHLTRGGLGTAVAELMAEHAIGKPLRRVGLRDTYGHGGSFPYLQKFYGLDGRAIINQAEGILGKSLNITDDELAAARIEPEHGAHKPEAL